MQNAKWGSGYFKIPKQTAKWDSSYIKKKEKKNFSQPCYVDSNLRNFFSLGNNFIFNIIMGKDSQNLWNPKHPQLNHRDLHHPLPPIVNRALAVGSLLDQHTNVGPLLH